ncbi:MAG: benzoyl-CoA reductase subunit B [Candidatus Eisenbacteria bacterium]|uniref:Benzoyl-CoA reductase subunit B n=1 Tax=Eiseniibacteriota bacterium TaxID=2212470 RepID=A0A956LXC7_UNCEI|nr:benzoyl-CoA reductase subunit B [Candidatus Eisenbacteria bacterium]
MVLQKNMIAEHFRQLEEAPQTRTPVVYTFVPGNLTELVRSFGALPVLPEINALQSGMRGKSRDYIAEAERAGHSEDVCTYVKCDIGQALAGNIGPTGTKLPKPDLLLLSYTGCYTFMKWFELLREHYGCPTVFLQVPYQGDGRLAPEHRAYLMEQIRTEVIPALENVTGRKYDEDRLRHYLSLSRQAEDDLVAVLETAKRKPSPIDAYFGAVYYVGPIFSAFRGTEDGVRYYHELRREVEERARAGRGPITPDGPLDEQRYRLVVEGPPNWTNFREFWGMFTAEQAVVVASTYTKVGGVYEFGFRHDPEDPLGTMADYCGGCYTNLNLPSRVDMLAHYVKEYEADGFLINSIKSCNSFSAGQLLMLREVEKRTGLPGAFVESDLVDPRYFSAANIKNRLESYLQMIDARRQGVGA